MTAGAGAGGMRAPGWSRVVLRTVAVVAAMIWALVLAGEGRRVERDPKFCASSCDHEPGPRNLGASSDWHAGGHADIPCQDCHTTSLATGLRLLWQTYVKSATPPEHRFAQPKPVHQMVSANFSGYSIDTATPRIIENIPTTRDRRKPYRTLK